MESAALLPPELVAAPEGFARLRGAALPDAGGGRGPPQGFAGVLEAASQGRLPDGDGLPVGGKRLPLDTAQALAPDARLAAWLAAVDASALGVVGTTAAAAAAAAQAGVLDAAEASAADAAQAPLPAPFSAGGDLDAEMLAQAGLPSETLGARVTADGAAPGPRGPGVFMPPAGAQAAPASGPAPGDSSGGASGGTPTAAAAANLAAALVDAAAATRGSSPAEAQAASVAPFAPFAPSVQRAAEQPAALAFDAMGLARGAAGAATLPQPDAGVPGTGALPAADASVAAPAQAGALLERAARAQAEATDGEPGEIVAPRLGAERALADALRLAGGTAETTAASGGVGVPQAAAVAAPSAGAPQAAEPAAAHGHTHALDLDDAAWNEQLMGRIRWLVDRDIGEARIKLHPADLGSLDVKIAVRDEQTFVQLVASSAAARDELEQSLPRLRELLGQMGLTLAGATVSGGREEQAAYSAYGGRVPYVPDMGRVVEEEPAALRPPPTAADGRIDLYA